MNKLLPGVNDLSTVRPNLTSEWDCEKNSPLCPSDIHAFSNKKYWWRCKRNHSWLATPNNRSNGYGCPYCSGRRAIKGETDLASCFPELLSEWDYEKNSVDPSTQILQKNGIMPRTRHYSHPISCLIPIRNSGGNALKVMNGKQKRTIVSREKDVPIVQDIE